MAEAVKKWHGSEIKECDICGVDLTKHKHFIDGRTSYGPWAIMCPLCHMLDGVGLGVGRGQKYEVKSLLKVDG